MKRIFAALTAVLLALVGLVVVTTSASAHTPSASATCDALTVNLTNYQPQVAAVPDTTKRYFTRYAFNPGQGWDGTAPTGTPFSDLAHWQLNNKPDPGNDPIGVAFQQGTGQNASWFYWIYKDVVTPGSGAKTNHVTVSVDGNVLANVDFGTSYSNTFPFADRTVSHTWKVVVTAWDDPSGGKGWTTTIRGTSTPCVPPTKPPVLTTYTDWVDGTWGCGDTTVTQTRSKSVIDYVLVNNVWVAQSAVNTVETQTRDLSPGEYVPARQCITRPDDYNTYEWTQAGEPKCGEASYIQKGFIIKHVFTWNDEIVNWKESTTTEPTTRTVEITATPCPTETPTPTPTPTPKSTCDDFATQAEAQAAFEAGATWLDGDADGRACDSLTTPTPSPSVSETPVVTATPAAPSLAYTGSQTGFVLVVVLILVGAGVASVLIARRGTR